jgi:hypothetical protein
MGCKYDTAQGAWRKGRGEAVEWGCFPFDLFFRRLIFSSRLSGDKRLFGLLFWLAGFWYGFGCIIIGGVLFLFLFFLYSVD